MASTILVKEIPDDIYRQIVKEQGKVKERIGTQFNQSKTVIKMLRDYIRCREVNNFKPQDA